MRIAWLKVGGLWPATSGGRQRTLRTLLALCQRHRVTVFTTHRPDEDPDELKQNLGGAERVVSIPFEAPKYGSVRFPLALASSWVSRYPVDLWKWRSRRVQDAMSEIIRAGGFDVVVTDFLFTDLNVPRGTGVPVVFFAHNVEFMIWKRLADAAGSSWRRPLLEIEWRKLRRCEFEVVRRADVTVAVSEADRQVFLSGSPGSQVEVVNTGVDVEFFVPRAEAPVADRLVFTGSMDWYPNEDAILHFAQHVWPTLRHRRPSISLAVVGRNPTARLRDAARQYGFTVTGTVDDVRPYVDDASLYVVPLRIGGGTRLKIFEALAMAKPVVSTTVGAEGLGLEPGREFVAADGDAAFAEAIERLLDDPDRRQALGAAGRELVATKYTWSHVALEFERHIAKALRRRDEVNVRYTAGRAPVPSR